MVWAQQIPRETSRESCSKGAASLRLGTTGAGLRRGTCHTHGTYRTWWDLHDSRIYPARTSVGLGTAWTPSAACRLPPGNVPVLGRH